jgi:hypothetical protein
MANLTATYMSRVMCQMDERERLADLGIDPRRADDRWMSTESLGELPKVSEVMDRMFSLKLEADRCRSTTVFQRNLMSRYDEDAPAIPPVKPQCMSTSSKANPLKQETQEGWEEWSWKDKVRS